MVRISLAAEIPVTLHDLLMARLDRLGPGKEVIQIGAVNGSEFSFEVLNAVHPIAEQDLQGALKSAIDAELVYVRGIVPGASYQFKHALIRDAAYEALLFFPLQLALASALQIKLPVPHRKAPAILSRSKIDTLHEHW
jgi:hypothetical protein